MTLVTEQRQASPVSPSSEGPLGGHPGVGQRSRFGRLRRLRTESGLVFLLALAAYLVVMGLLDLVFNIFPLDAVSRMANGYYVLYSRDPHLAAIGFVWNPLQSLAVIPVLLFKDLWPALATHDVAAGLVSAFASAGAVYQIHAALGELRIRKVPRLLLVVVFALNPMIIYYAGNGMSDALYLFTLVATTRYLLRWLHHDDLRSLAYAAVALGVAYLDRNEAVGSALLAGALVFAVSYSRAPGVRRSRLMSAATDGAVLLMPVVTAFAAWAIASDVITGQPFAQFTSQYGNSAQVAVSGLHATLSARVLHDVVSIEYLAPLLPIVLVLALILALRRRDLRVLGPLAVLGGSLAFDALGVLTNTIEPFYRYYLTAVPLDVFLVGCVIAAAPRPSPSPHRGSPGDDARRVSLKTVVATTFVIVVGVASIPASALGIFAKKDIQSTESQELGALVLAHPDLEQRQFADHYGHIESIDAYLDSMHLPEGSIVVDTFGECTPQIVTTVTDPRIFVITNDRDFKQVLSDPLTFHAHYLLSPRPTGADVNDALNVAYPNLYQNGAGFSTLVHQFRSDGICAPYRLYRVTGHPGE